MTQIAEIDWINFKIILAWKRSF